MNAEALKWYREGQGHFLKKNAGGAILCYRKANACDGTSWEVLSDLGACYYHVGRIGDAEECIRASLSLHESAAAYCNLGNCLKQTDLPEAFRMYVKSVECQMRDTGTLAHGVWGNLLLTSNYADFLSVEARADLHFRYGAAAGRECVHNDLHRAVREISPIVDILEWDEGGCVTARPSYQMAIHVRDNRAYKIIVERVGTYEQEKERTDGAGDEAQGVGEGCGSGSQGEGVHLHCVRRG